MSTEEHKVSGKNLLDRVKQIVHEGNVRRITIRNPEGKSLLDIPLTAGVVGVVLLPFWAAIGAIAALATDYTIVVEKEDEPGSSVRVTHASRVSIVNILRVQRFRVFTRTIRVGSEAGLRGGARPVLVFLANK